MDFGDLETELTEVNVEPEITGEYIPEPFENTKRSQIEAVLQVVQDETPVFTAPMLRERSRRSTLFTPSRSAQVMPDRNEESVLVRMYSPTRRWRQYLKDTKDPTAEKLKDDERKELKLFLRAICLKCSSDCTTWMLQKSVFMAHSHPPRCHCEPKGNQGYALWICGGYSDWVIPCRREELTSRGFGFRDQMALIQLRLHPLSYHRLVRLKKKWIIDVEEINVEIGGDTKSLICVEATPHPEVKPYLI